MGCAFSDSAAFVGEVVADSVPLHLQYTKPGFHGTLRRRQPAPVALPASLLGSASSRR